jgi:hypothetical protein
MTATAADARVISNNAMTVFIGSFEFANAGDKLVVNTATVPAADAKARSDKATSWLASCSYRR